MEAFFKPFNEVVNWFVSLIWGNGDWLVLNNPWYGLIVFLLVGGGIYFTSIRSTHLSIWIISPILNGACADIILY